MRIAVADDDPMILMALETILGASGEVEICGSGNSGARAVELYRELRPDVLLMDIRMEGMDGLEALERMLKPIGSLQSVGLVARGLLPIGRSLCTRTIARITSSNGLSRRAFITE